MTGEGATIVDEALLGGLLERTAALHDHLCPRQVLGVRMGLYAGRLLGLDVPQTGKRLVTIMETDGCGADGVAVATNCWVGRRTLLVVDYGKMAATFVDREAGRSVRIRPAPAAREAADCKAPDAATSWEAMLLGYQRLPDEVLFEWRPVRLKTDIEVVVSRPGLRAVCDGCGEEVMNEREVARENGIFCRACADGAYYVAAE